VTIELEHVITILVRVANCHNVDNVHGERTSAVALAIGKRLNGGMRLDKEKLQLLNYAARIHDLGRVGIDNAIISKRGWLTKSQFAAVKEHSVIGYEFVKDILPAEITLTILHHHEHWDGTGYPKGLKGMDIPLFARIVSIADSWDALISDRPYRKAKPHGDALADMNKMAEWFDPILYTHFLEVLRDAHGRN